MAGQAGGYSLMGFTKKDAYNYINKAKRAKIIDGDANTAVVYLEEKAGADPMSMARYNLTKDNMLTNMFWADGGSRVDYQYFGDVLAFDSTYKKNKCQRLLKPSVVVTDGCDSMDKYAEIAKVGSERGFLLSHGALHAAAQWMLYVGARSPSSFTQALNGLHTLCQELDRGHENVRQNKAHDTVEMHDPAVVKTKGAPRVKRHGRWKRRCTRYRKTGHTK
ncbi:hypothetical protein Ahy_A09g042980 isoform B [Arachis hypogaea]|uniref:Uncharacterized protein n=1 Tax=Arachis hypogaea TaxID=3818 RepID=A0A445BH86_ARAHY|nr:hypothetical protein Ahy_A09g042980 isoform B [Arachis hypogaea]